MALFEFSIQFFGDLDYSNLEYLGSMSNSADIFWTDIMWLLRIFTVKSMTEAAMYVRMNFQAAALMISKSC